MRSRYLVSYDVSDKKRLRQIHRLLCGYGDPLQYSVFTCELARTERFQLLHLLADLIHHQEDRVMLVDLGPSDGRGAAACTFLGRTVPAEARPVAIIV